MFPVSHSTFSLRRVLSALLFMAGIVLTAGVPAAPTDVTGVVYRDYNADGIQNAGEPGLAGVTVFAVDAAGTTDSVVTAADGSYTLPTGSLSGEVRLEFRPTADQTGYLFPASAGSTSVEFVDIAAGDVVDVGFNNPAQYFSADTDLTTSYYTNGESVNSGSGPNQALVAWDYTARTTPNTNGAPTTLSERANIGATWGLAYDRARETVYAASFLKRHSGLQNGPGTIFAVDPNGGINGTPFVDLTAAPFNLDFGEPGTDADRGLPNDPTTLNTDPDAFYQVGKFGIGDLDISEDYQTLWFVNLFDKTLYSLEIDSDDNPATPPDASDLQSYALPTNQCNQYSTIYINGGGTNHGALNNAAWDGDGYYINGLSQAGDGVGAPYDTQRRAVSGSMRYSVPVPDGTYDLTFYIHRDSAITYDITIEGNAQTVNVPADTDFTVNRSVTVTDGTLNILFTGGIDPIVNGIEITATGGQQFEEAQPFGLKIHDGDVYVGLTCTAEYSQDDIDLDAYVYQLDGGSFTQLATFALDYTKGPASTNGTCDGATSAWHPWSTRFPSTCSSSRVVWPQPMLSGLEFDTDNTLIVSVADRLGHQLGNFNRNLDDSETREGVIGGDILRVYNDAGTYTLESNATAGPLTANWLTGDNGVGNGQGPGGGEFYQDDASPPRSHQETPVGGVLHWFGTGEVVATTMDPHGDAVSGGVLFFNNERGSSTTGAGDQTFDAYEVYQSTNVATFGKSNGIGDLEPISALAPTEIGNRIWSDADSDGLQDPGEAGVAGVTVQLWADTNDDGTADTQVADTTTDADGNYLFSTAGANVYGQTEDWSFTAADAVDGETAYEVRVDTTQGGALSGLVLTTADAAQPAAGNTSVSDNNPFTDLADSDAALDVVTAVIAYTTDQAGANNHTLDIGFAPPGDYGDLPDSFDTTSANNGPNHGIDPNLYLGACVDGEADGIPVGNAGVDGAGGDDGDVGAATGTCATAGDDEEGITAVTPLIPGSEACVTVTAVNGTGGDANLYGFIDYNGDGDFDGDTDDLLTGGTNGTPFTGGAATVPDGGVSALPYCFDVPAGATFDGGETHLRFRLTTDTLSGDQWAGSASDGEVEDYYLPLVCVGNYLWLDTGTTADEQDAGDTAVSGVTVNLVWGGPDDTVGSGGDDVTYSTVTAADGSYAFCGLFTDASNGTPDQYQVIVPTAPGTPVTADQGGDDALDSDGTANGTASDGPTFTVPIPNPATDNAGNDIDPNNFPDDNTDLTYDFGFQPVLDWGDLPDTLNTSSGSNGAAHQTDGSLYLGSCVDAEGDGQPTMTADGDDVGAGTSTDGTCAVLNDDEDGVTRTGNFSDGDGNLDVVSSADACLNIWFDFTDGATPVADQSFDDTLSGVDEHVVENELVTAGSNAVSFTLPAGVADDANPTYMRVRLTPRDADNGCAAAEAYGGTAVHTGTVIGGEVEDYRYPFSPTAVTVSQSATESGPAWPMVTLVTALLLLSGTALLARRRMAIRIE